MNRPCIIPQKQWPKVIKCYHQMKSVHKVAAAFGVSTHPILYVLRATKSGPIPRLGRNVIVIQKGARFGRLTYLQNVGGCTGKDRRAKFKCDCGTILVTSLYEVRRGNSRSCGCLMREEVAARMTTHGYFGTSICHIWHNMRDRCNNAKSRSYKRYGGRGIKVCKRWEKFENFLADMGEPPSSRHSIDRIDNDGNYEPSNCRWALPHEQLSNTSQNVWLDYNGEKISLPNLARKVGVSRNKLYYRIVRAGWPIDKAVATL